MHALDPGDGWCSSPGFLAGTIAERVSHASLATSDTVDNASPRVGNDESLDASKIPTPEPSHEAQWDLVGHIIMYSSRQNLGSKECAMITY